MDYDELRRIYRLEKNTSKLVKVDKTFFADLQEFVEKERQDYLNFLKEGNFTKAKDFTNLKKLVEELLSLREKKLLNAALISSRTEESPESNLCDDELKTFNKLLKILQDHREMYMQLFEASESARKAKGRDLNKISLRILREVPSFVGVDMKEYGPFSPNQSIELPLKTAELLIERKLAESI